VQVTAEAEEAFFAAMHIRTEQPEACCR